MKLIKKIHYFLIYIKLRSEKIPHNHAKIMAEQYNYFYFERRAKK